MAATASLVAISRAATLTLDDAIRFALQKNQSLKVSAFTPQIARANVMTELGNFDPALTFRRTYSESEQPISTGPLVTQVAKHDDYSLSLGGVTPWGLSYSLGGTAQNQRDTANRFTDNYVTFGGISITQPLLRGFGFGANLAGLRIAKADRRISDWLYRQSVIDTVTSVILVYNNVSQLRENVKIARSARELTALLVQQNEKKNQLGAMSDADVLAARAQLAQREESILLAERVARDTENQLRQLVGETHYPVDGPPLEIETLAPAPPIVVDAAADLKRAYDLRPDYQAGKAGIDRRRANAAFAKNQLLPRVDFVGSYGYTGIDRDFGRSRAQVRSEDVRSYSAGLVVSVPLTFMEGRGRARAAQLSVRQSEADLVRLEQDIAVDIAAAAGQVQTTRERVVVARTALELAEKSLNAEQLKLQAGSGRTLDVLNSQRDLSNVQNSYARAQADERRARANYERELGVTLELRNITLD
ncbi:MAG TPA: TolC family protein [Opitutaceae bacterium]|nr:TolC family protein [Opitutaceae bacterium]